MDFKKLIAVLAALSLLLLVIGCASSDVPAETGEEVPTEEAPSDDAEIEGDVTKRIGETAGIPKIEGSTGGN